MLSQTCGGQVLVNRIQL